MNRKIGTAGFIIWFLIQSFSDTGSLLNEINSLLFFVFLMIYFFDQAKSYSNVSLAVICISFLILIFCVHRLLSFSRDLFDNVNINFGLIFILQITIIIGSATIAMSIMKFICDRLKKKPNGKEC
ncbi:YoqO family protein [Bacillus vallismortis]|uniref:YoqO family protein n=1 Tax=Bacillus vallismortis TaxID=72361 RepID=UPI0022814A6B|nr:YoqO family protein [Bacillus vallismortis]MCY7919081.1 hypothetical protein [Bacillus vallismortis]